MRPGNVLSKINAMIKRFVNKHSLHSAGLLLLLFALRPIISQAQNKPDVAGVVQSPQGEKMPGVSVKAVQVATNKVSFQVTNEKGLFKFDNLVAGDNYEFIFSSVGYKTQQLQGYTIKKGETINLIVRMKLRDDSLAQVVVVGYGTQKKANVTGAISQVGSEVFEDRPITNIAQGLQGAIPNLNITFGDGRIGRGGDFNVRGITSINGGGPLILIDGTPGDINMINPEDVASVTVLKDAASAAIYGARAAFGVILVTTRKGKTGAPQVRYTNSFGWSKPTRLPHVVNDPLAAATLQNEAYRGYAGGDQPGMPDVIAYLKKRQEDPSLPELGVDAAGNFIRGANTDWYREFYNDQQPFSKHYVSLSGGKGNTNYFISAGYMKQQGAFRVATDDYKKYSLRLKLDNQVTDWLKIYDNVEMIQGLYDAPNKFVANGFNVYRYLSLFANPYEAIKTPSGNYTQAGMLTFGQLEKGGRSLQKDQLLKNTLGFQTSFLNNKLRFNGDYTVFVTQNRNDIQNIRLKYENKPGSIAAYSNQDYTAASMGETLNQVVNLYTEYEQRIGQHHFKGLLGFNQELNKYSYFTARRDDNITQEQSALNLTSGVATVGDNKREWAIRGVFYRLNYDFKDRYLLELNGRYDGTSKFADSSRYAFFPSVSAGWIISKEPFFQPLSKAFSNLKVRASYGSLGNQLSLSEYTYLNTLGVYKTSDILDGAQPLAVGAPGLMPVNLTWETATTLDFGLDFTALRNRLDVGFDWFNRTTTRMLTKGKTLPAVLGATEPKQNAADLSTKGWEFSVKWNDRSTLFGKPFSYNFGVVLSDSRSFITKFDNPNKFLGDYYEGMELGEIWGYKTLGFFQTDEEYKTHVDQHLVQSLAYSLNGHPMAGDIKFENRNGDDKISNGKNTVDDPGDMYKIGNDRPRYAYGVSAGANWNGISLDVFFQGIGKRDFWPEAESGVFWGFYNRWNQPVYDHIYNNYWTPENPNAYFPRPRAYDAFDASRQLGVKQTRYLQNAAYLRLKNLTAGYTIPAKWTTHIGIDKARIFFSGQNLFEFTRISKAFDPEGINDEVDGGTSNGRGFVYPIQRTYTFGIDVNF